VNNAPAGLLPCDILALNVFAELRRLLGDGLSLRMREEWSSNACVRAGTGFPVICLIAFHYTTGIVEVEPFTGSASLGAVGFELADPDFFHKLVEYIKRLHALLQ